MAHAMRETGKRISNTARDWRHGLMELVMKETMLKERSTEQADSPGLMAVHTLVNSKRITLKEEVYTSGLMAESMKVNGKTIKWRDTEYSHGPMAEDTRESISMIRKKAKESFSGKTFLSFFTIYFRPDGRKYDGEWLNSLKHGKGADFFANGDRYVGEYKDGKPNGEGV